MNTTYGLLIDYEYCTGCQSCEVACKEEHDYPVGKWGVRVYMDGPWKMDECTYNYNNVPVPTDLCDLCRDRTEQDREPTCVHHCLANVMAYGTIDELAEKLKRKPKQVLFVPQYKPFEDRGPFVPQNKFREGRRKAQAIEVDANANFTTSSQRADSRTDTGAAE